MVHSSYGRGGKSAEILKFSFFLLVVAAAVQGRIQPGTELTFKNVRLFLFFVFFFLFFSLVPQPLRHNFHKM